MREPSTDPRCMGRGDSVGRYLVLEPIGTGGLGTVYRAYDPDLDRAVALKEVHAVTADAPGHRATVLREAQAMARLTHPNVVVVYDVIAANRGVFIAMELVDGQDLKQWLAGAPSLDQIVAVFIDCARGLAAAHRANLCHRDVKPSNLLVSRDGAGKVADFGLARPADRAVGPDVNARDRMAVRDAIDSETASDAIAGTADYLAPEVQAGQPADPLADQYSFSVSLYEAVTGHLPPTPTEPTEKIGNVPRSLRRFFARALAPEPANRFPTMDGVVGALQAVRTRRRTLALRVAAVAAIGATIAVAVGPRTPAPCTGFSTRWAGVWDHAQRASIGNTLETAGVPDAEAAAARVVQTLDDYTQQWTRAHQEACEASLVRNEQSAQLYQARSLCYEHRWEQTRALVEVLQTADAEMAAALSDPAGALDPLEPCGTKAELLLQVAPATDPSDREDARKIRGRLADAAALAWAGRGTQSRRVAEAAAADADVLQYPPLQAEARLRAGIAAIATGAYETALGDLSTAHFIAEAHRHDRIAAAAAVGNVALLSTHLEQPQRAQEWAQQASASVDRLGAPGIEAIELHNALGTMAQVAGELPEALEHYEKALALAEAQTMPRRVEVGLILQNLATTLEGLGRFDEAQSRYDQALGHFEQELGAQHPHVAMVLHNMCLFSHAQGRSREAIAFARRALRLKESALPDPHLSLARTLLVMGPILLELGDDKEARAVLVRAQRIVQDVVGPDHPQMGIALTNLGAVSQHVGDLGAARRDFEAAIRIFRQTYPEGHPLVLQAREHLAGLPSATTDGQ